MLILILILVPLGVPKDVLMQKVDLQTQRANTRFKR